MLTRYNNYDILEIGMSIDITIVNEPLSESQGRGEVTSRTAGLRVLARLIGKHILAERRVNSFSEDAKKSTTRRYYRSDLEDLY